MVAVGAVMCLPRLSTISSQFTSENHIWRISDATSCGVADG